ncbi:MAG: STAS domain-containing protein [Phycisphaerae bacterium]|jgi:anti-sigma B factor antagonist
MSEETSTLRLSESDGVTIVSFKDASILDALSIQRIGQQLYQVVDAPNRSKVVLDFSAVRFLSSQALGVLLTLRRKADKAGVKIALCAIRPELFRVFTITNLNQFFAFFDTTQDAVAGLNK